MPHDQPTSTHTDNEWGWLDNTPPTPLPTRYPEHRCSGEAEWLWLENDLRDGETAEHTADKPECRATGSQMRRWAGPILATTAAAIVIITAVIVLGATDGPTAAIPETASVPAASPPLLAAACADLSGQTITDGRGDTSTVPGVIAAFEYSYYQQRSAAVAVGLLAPESGISAEPLAAGIASIPVGTTHCVAITPIADTTANVHLVELHPDHTRTDYLQVINLRRTETGLLINNIQKQG